MAKGHRRTIAIALAAAMVAVGLTALVWQPWQSDSVATSLPNSACWGVLNQADAASVMGSSKKVTSSDDGTLVTGLSNSARSACLIYGGGGKTLLSRVWVFSEASNVARLKGISGNRITALNSEVNVVAFPTGVALYFNCQDAAYAQGWPYAAVQVDSGSTSSASGWQPGYANIALKIAKAVAPQAPCRNTITWPTTIPSSAASPS
ncbi:MULTISPECIES: hypothetical protein [Streptacidiphilus]|uniref:DUF4232 domain-containing protein n=1 Tax=Streptacidiphilus cavernicola TaxID=3342716 RepID=A0ABV6ULP8_9ACTN|nr:hypothetical protein [Streptacidiphilus jeojiense]